MSDLPLRSLHDQGLDMGDPLTLKVRGCPAPFFIHGKGKAAFGLYWRITLYWVSSTDMYNNDVGQESAQKFMKQTGDLKADTLYFAS